MVEMKEWRKIRIMVPERDAYRVEQKLDDLSDYFELENKSLGQLGNYSYVRYRMPIIEHFSANSTSNPCELRAPACVCIETWCVPGIVDAVVRAIQEEHPYEHPVIEIVQVLLADPLPGKIPISHTKAARRLTTILPSGQALTKNRKWPVVGEKQPKTSDAPWIVSVLGEVEKPLSWSLEELMSMPQIEQMVNIHCVTRWTLPHCLFRGISLQSLLDHCRPKTDAQFVSFIARSDYNHGTSLPLGTARDLKTLIAFSCDGKPLEVQHGGPIRVIVPGRYFYKSLKWLEKIELLKEDRLGYWEESAGYHNNADPWLEQRYIVGGRKVPEKTMRDLVARNISGQDILNLNVSLQQLDNLDAESSILRNADFRNADISKACFQKANLSNAHFEGANLQGANFRDADVEGANFRGADLRGADFRGASLFGATFCPEPDDHDTWGVSILDGSTMISLSQIESLSEAQQRFLVSNCSNSGVHD